LKLFKNRKQRSLIGQNALIGLTYLDEHGEVVRRSELYGEIIEADPNSVVRLRLHDTGTEFTLPPDLDAFRPAEPGFYRLHSTGQEIEDPDLIATWTISAPPSDDAE
jgi:hypothetical protein